jgi:putative membrane protein
MKKMFIVAASLVFVLTACNKDEENDVNATDREYVRLASISNNAEVQTGQLAATKGNSAAVKAFGSQMVMEHGMAQTDLKNRASAAGLSVADTVDAEHRMIAAYLNTLSGYSFDTAYINSQVKDHQRTINFFQMEINDGNHQQLRSYANQYLPHIQMHFNRADSIRRVL